jgi:hypothetical protein
MKRNFQLGEKYKSYSFNDLDKTGPYDIFEVVLDKDSELSFYNHTDKKIYDLRFLGALDLVPMSIIRFCIHSKDFKENWDDHKERIEQIVAAGFPVQQEVSGEAFGIDSDFLIFTEEELPTEALKLLTEVVENDLFFWDEIKHTDSEAELTSIRAQIKHIVDVTTTVENGYEVDTIELENGDILKFVNVPTKSQSSNEEPVDNATLLERIRKWQEEPVFHPLTCGVDSKHALLKGVEEEGKIILFCPTCNYKQSYLPKLFLYDQFDGLYNHQKVFIDSIKEALSKGNEAKEQDSK